MAPSRPYLYALLARPYLRDNETKKVTAFTMIAVSTTAPTNMPTTITRMSRVGSIRTATSTANNTPSSTNPAIVHPMTERMSAKSGLPQSDPFDSVPYGVLLEKYDPGSPH